MKVVFEAIGNVKPTCIVIDKHKTSLLAIQKVVDEDKYCWRDELVDTEQIAGKFLLCGFHVMKAWSENLLTCIPLHLKKCVIISVYSNALLKWNYLRLWVREVLWWVQGYRRCSDLYSIWMGQSWGVMKEYVAYLGEPLPLWRYGYN